MDSIKACLCVGRSSHAAALLCAFPPPPPHEQGASARRGAACLGYARGKEASAAEVTW